MNSAAGIDGAVSSDVIGYFQAITCFDHALSLDTVGYKQGRDRVSCIPDPRPNPSVSVVLLICSKKGSDTP
jgi:hypothetical protein